MRTRKGAVVWITRMWHFSAMGKKCVALIKSDAAVVAERNYVRVAAATSVYTGSQLPPFLLPTATYFFSPSFAPALPAFPRFLPFFLPERHTSAHRAL